MKYKKKTAILIESFVYILRNFREFRLLSSVFISIQ